MTTGMRILCTSFLAAALSLGCGDDDRPGGTDAGRDSGSSGGVNTCVDLCALTEAATPVQGGCTADYATARGYNTDHPDCLALSDAFVAGTATAAMCNACYGAIGVTDADCRGAHSSCFGMMMPPEDGGGMPPVDSGMMPPVDAGRDTGGGGAVDTCAELCALTPMTTPLQGGCTADVIDGLGYMTDNVPCGLLAASFAAGTATVAECNACYSAIAVTDAHCMAAHLACF